MSPTWREKYTPKNEVGKKRAINSSIIRLKMSQQNIGNQLAKARLSKGWTQTELAVKCNVSARTIQRIEAGTVTPRNYTIRLLSETLCTDLFNQRAVSNSNSTRPSLWTLLFLQIKKTCSYLFNFKKNPMQKLLIFSIVLVTTGVMLFLFTKQGVAQGSSQPINFLDIEINESISQKESLKIVRGIKAKVNFHTTSFDVLEVYIRKSNHNYSTYAHIGKLIGSFGHSTLPVMEIANITFYSNKESKLYPEIATLVFLNDNGVDNLIKLAKSVRNTESETKLNLISEQINTLKERAKYKEIEEAYFAQNR